MRDKNLVYSDEQAITGTAVSTNVINHGAAGMDKGAPLSVELLVTEDFDALTSLAIALQTDDNEAFSSATTVDTITVALAALVKGAQFVLNFKPGVEKYTRISYTVTGTDPTVGKIFAATINNNRMHTAS